MAWPPDLDALKVDMGIDDDDVRDDEKLQLDLDAAIAYVQRVRSGDFNFVGDPDSTMPAPSSDLILGTLRYAARSATRRNSPDGMVSLGDATGRVASFDSDIEKNLGIGRFRGPVIA